MSTRPIADPHAKRPLIFRLLRPARLIFQSFHVFVQAALHEGSVCLADLAGGLNALYSLIPDMTLTADTT